jgi:hypothetical protein
MKGIGKTIFSGDRIEEFQVEVLGVLDNVGPKQSVILARLSGGPLEHTGVLQGMSGSPVYIDGKLVGAVALAFTYAKDPIAGIRPIEEMVAPAPAQTAPARRAAVDLGERDLLRLFPRPQPAMVGEARLMDIATPISFSGFSRDTLETFAPQLRALGLQPAQGQVSSGAIPATLGNAANLKPGSMISVQLMSGDMTAGADGTVTHIDGNRIYAFGHRLLAVGSTALPFARSEVVALLPALNNSSKLTATKEWMGVISQDRDTFISGELGRLPDLTPFSIAVIRDGQPVTTYQMRMVNDGLLSPLLIQMAVSSAIDATERTAGPSSIRLTGEIEFANAPAPIRIANIYAADSGAANQAALAAAVPAAYVMQSGFDALSLKRVSLTLETFDRKKELTIDGVTVSRQKARPGDTVSLRVSLVGQNGAETVRQVDYQVPVGAAPGTLYFTVADATTTNLADFRQVLSATLRTPSQVIGTVNGLHPNTKAYVRVWRSTTAYQLEGADLPAPPASAAMILAGAQASLAGVSQTRNSRLAQIEVDAGDMAVTGSKTVQIEIQE